MSSFESNKLHLRVTFSNLTSHIMCPSWMDKTDCDDVLTLLIHHRLQLSLEERFLFFGGPGCCESDTNETTPKRLSMSGLDATGMIT